ncbi:major facilitator superfamily domain-containing protein [Gorgonomyces haynaldii]|nr:major facilitator superfamily domain-containing protein [Gorgonomyces haynaldii]
MVKQWVEHEQDVGYYVGFIASAFSVSQFVTSLLWGYLSDRFGRRPCLLFGLIGNTISIIGFGMSKSLVEAIFWRSLNGLLNGNAGVAKSMLAELTDDTNRASAFSLFGFTFAIGIILGPVMGGFLANPAQTMPDIFGKWDLFVQNPFLLPCLVSSLISTFGFVFGLMFLPETAPLVRQSTDDVEDEASPLLGDASHSGSSPSTVASTSTITGGIGWPAIQAISAYSLLAFIIVCFDEVYSVWANSPIGTGLGFSPREVGMSLSPMGLVLLFVQIVVYPWIMRYVSSLTLYKYGMLFYPIIFMCFPIISNWIAPVPEWQHLTWPLLWIFLGLRYFVGSLTFTAVMILVSNSAKPGMLGVVNGYGQMGGSFVRTVGPSLGSSIFAWSIQSGIAFPLDKNLIFLLLSLLGLISVIQAWSLSPSLDKSAS